MKKFYNDNCELHREDGPAVDYNNGSGEWYLNGKRHREDGPAVESVDGYCEYWLFGKWFLFKSDWQNEIIKLKLKRLSEL